MLKFNILAFLCLIVQIYSLRRHHCIHDELIQKHGKIKLARI
jgi:hypothetical protein